MSRKRARLRSLSSGLRTLDLRTARPAPKTVDPIYKTPEYQRWREEVIRRAGRRCEWPGCGRSEPRMFADHIVELKDGGAPFDPANGQCLCGSCHTRKTARAREARQAARPGA